MSIYAIGLPGHPVRTFFRYMSDQEVVNQLEAGEVALVAEVMGSLTISDDGKDLLPLVSSLGEAKASKWNDAKLYRDAVMRGGCSTPLGRVQTNASSYHRILGAAQAAQASGAPYSVRWTMADNSIVEHDAPAVIAMGVAVTEFLNACQGVGEAIRAAIEAALDADALATVDLTAGYPA